MTQSRLSWKRGSVKKHSLTKLHQSYHIAGLKFPLQIREVFGHDVGRCHPTRIDNEGSILDVLDGSNDGARIDCEVDGLLIRNVFDAVILPNVFNQIHLLDFVLVEQEL